jgi:hypothetical protein
MKNSLTNLEKAITEYYGRRCSNKDLDEMPELAGSEQGRCPCCVVWEKYDELVKYIDLTEEQNG